MVTLQAMDMKLFFMSVDEKKDFFFFFGRGRERGGAGAEGQGKRGSRVVSVLSTEPSVGLDLTTPGS